MTVTPLPERRRVDVGELGGSLYQRCRPCGCADRGLDDGLARGKRPRAESAAKLELVNAALLSTAGLEQGFSAELKGKLGEAGIETWNA